MRFPKHNLIVLSRSSSYGLEHNCEAHSVSPYLEPNFISSGSFSPGMGSLEFRGLSPGSLIPEEKTGNFTALWATTQSPVTQAQPPVCMLCADTLETLLKLLWTIADSATDSAAEIGGCQGQGGASVLRSSTQRKLQHPFQLLTSEPPLEEGLLWECSS